MTHPQDVEPAGLKPDPIYDALWELCAALANEGPPKTPRAHTAWKAGRSACLERLKADADRIASPSPSGDVREAVARITREALERIARLSDPSRRLERPRLNLDTIADIAANALSKADQIAALYVERIGVETASASEPVVHPGDGDGNDSTPLTHANKMRTSVEPQT